MKPTTAPLPANTPIVKSAKTNPVKTVKTNSVPASPSPKITTKPTPVAQIALPFDTPRVTPVPKAPRQPRAVAVAKPTRAASTPVRKPKMIPVKNAKTNPTPGGSPKTANHSVKVVNEPVLEGGALWKMSGRHGVAYVKDAIVAGELLATDPKNLPKHAMAVYYDKKGKAFAWQVRFDTSRWEEVLRRLG